MTVGALERKMKEIKRIMVCDQSINTFGFAIFEAGAEYKLIKYGVIQLNTKIHYFKRILTIDDTLDKLINQYKINQVMIEEIQKQKGVTTYKKLAALQFYLQYFFFNRQIPFQEPVHVSTWRTRDVKNLLELPNGAKKTLHKRIQNMLDNEKLTEDMSDAIGIGIWYGNELGYKTRDLINAEMEVIKIK